jgi:hypothetical protein
VFCQRFRVTFTVGVIVGTWVFQYHTSMKILEQPNIVFKLP